jgi:penicillin-binding protein 2
MKSADSVALPGSANDHRPLTIKKYRVAGNVFLNRITATLAIIILLSLALVVRLIYLQVMGHEHYTSLSRNNRVKISPVVPTRGLIYDRNGVMLAENLPTYSLDITPEQVEDLGETLVRLQALLGITDEEIEQFHTQRKRQRGFASIPLQLHLTDEELARFFVNRPYFPGVEVHARLVRHYPRNELTSHVVGYVGRINERELKRLDPGNYRGTQHIGKVGVEQSYETALHGQAGYQEVETNAQGRFISVLKTVPAAQGKDLYLTLDIGLQQTAYDALGDHTGAVSAIEVETGDVLVLVSKPGFDPNPFVYGISIKAYRALQTSPDRPLFNRALRGQYPPGSTIKPFVALAGLEYSAITARRAKLCPGFYQLPNHSHRYRDWKKWGHGSVDLRKAIVQSCDVYFYDLAHTLGIDRLHDFLQRLGFGEKSGIDLVGEKSGLLPSREWKRRARNQVWYPGETLITGIGQGFTQVTPLQLARATAILANRGRMVYPHIVSRTKTLAGITPWQQENEERVSLNSNHVNTVVRAMVDVVHSARGTARRIGVGVPYQIAGKTGTAQVFTVKQTETYQEHKVAKKLRDHALFIAFAPADHPRIAVAVIVENGGHGGSVAAPIAAQVIAQYLEES